VEDLARIRLRALAVADRMSGLVGARHARLAEVLLREDVGRDLTPVLGDVDVLDGEDDGAVRVANLRSALGEWNAVVR
jgi:hypothetical protein